MSWYRLLAAIAASARRSRKASGGGVAPSFVSAPALIGTPQVGVPMSYTVGVVGGSPAPTVTRQWLLAGAAITGATNLTYTPVSGDAGLALSVRETATNGVGSPANSTSGTANVTSVPAFTAPPVILGTPTAGTPVAYTQGTVTGSPTPTRSRQWLRNGTNISGATSTTYTPVDADIGTAILSVRETATNGVGSPANSTSTAQDVAGVAPSWTVAPAIIGLPTVGAACSLSAGTLAGAPAPTVTYQWTLNGSDISGATSATYTPITGDLGAALRRVTTASNGIGSPAVTTSAPGTVVSAAGAYTSTDALYDAKYAAALGAIPGGAKWVATTGNDTTGTGSSGNPYLTIQKALQNISAAGTVVIKNGTYTGASNWINSQATLPPNGTSWAAPTIIRAENPFMVRITQTAIPAGYTQSIIDVSTRTYIWIDGIIAESTWTAPAADHNAAVLCVLGDYCRISRGAAKMKSCGRYGGGLSYGNNSVAEDFHFFGSYRYAYQSPGGGASSPLGSSVLRRCVAYGTSGQVMEPTAPFSFYGADDRNYALVKDFAMINCYEIDSPHIPYRTGGAENHKWGALYCPKSVRNVRVLGCGALGGGALYGAFTGDGIQGKPGLWMDCIDTWVSNYTATYNAFWHNDGATNNITNCRTASLSGGMGNYTTGTVTLTNNDFSSSATNLLQRSGSNGSKQLYAIGPVMSRFGDTGYDVEQTDLPLWPFPYESFMASLFAETMTVPSNDIPNPGSSTANPFAGNSGLSGLPKTFTRRVWEARGTVTPSFASGAGVY